MVNCLTIKYDIHMICKITFQYRQCMRKYSTLQIQNVHGHSRSVFYNSCVNNLACLCLIQYLPFNQHYKITFQAECASVLQNKCADGNRVPRPTLVVLSNMHGTCFAPSCHLDVSFRHHVCSQS